LEGLEITMLIFNLIKKIMIKNIINIILLSFLFFTFSCEDPLQRGEEKRLTESEREAKRLERIKRDAEEMKKIWKRSPEEEKMREDSNIYW
jgi:hypothetical protein